MPSKPLGGATNLGASPRKPPGRGGDAPGRKEPGEGGSYKERKLMGTGHTWRRA